MDHLYDWGIVFKVGNCVQCPNYPCSKVQSIFEQTMQFEPNCKKYYSNEEYNLIRQAFLKKTQFGFNQKPRQMSMIPLLYSARIYQKHRIDSDFFAIYAVLFYSNSVLATF